MLFFSIIIVLCIIGWIATWIYAAYDMFKRRDMKTWHRVAWLAEEVHDWIRDREPVRR